MNVGFFLGSDNVGYVTIFLFVFRNNIGYLGFLFSGSDEGGGYVCLSLDVGYHGNNLLFVCFQEAMKEVGTSVEEIKVEVGKFEEQEQALSKQQIEVRHDMEKYETVVKENQDKVKYWKKEVGQGHIVGQRGSFKVD